MHDWQVTSREQLGLAIAALSKITPSGQLWLVPSQSVASRHYKVSLDPHAPHCTCPDHEETGQRCKHIAAAEYVRRRENSGLGRMTVQEIRVVTDATPKRRTYAQNWPAYNAAQTTEKTHFQSLLFDLCQLIEEPEQRRGRPRLPLSDVVFTATYKVYSAFSGRRFMDDLRVAHERGYISRLPHFNSIFNHFDNPALMPILQELIVETSKPFAAIETVFACDSSGFGTHRFLTWREKRFQQLDRRDRDWIKAHIICGVRTNIITAAEIHERNTADVNILPSLLKTTARHFSIAEVLADKAYLSHGNLGVIANHGAEAYIPFKSNNRQNGGPLWQKAFHFFHLHREEFLKHYHQRSNVEATFSMVKAKFRDSVRSKTQIAMRNEVYCKLLAHNICRMIHAMHERSITLDFTARQRSDIPSSFEAWGSLQSS